jgi:hypothetical protein
MLWLLSSNSLSEQKTNDHESAQIREASSVHENVLAQACIVGVIPGVAATSSAALKGEAEPQAESSCQPVAFKFLKYEVKYSYSHLPTLWIKFQSGSHHNTKPPGEKVDSVPLATRLARPINDLLTGGY